MGSPVLSESTLRCFVGQEPPLVELARPGFPRTSRPQFSRRVPAKACFTRTSLRVGRGALFLAKLAGDLLKNRSTVVLMGSFAAELAIEQRPDTDHQDGVPNLHPQRKAERVELGDWC